MAAGLHQEFMIVSIITAGKEEANIHSVNHGILQQRDCVCSLA